MFDARPESNPKRWQPGDVLFFLALAVPFVQWLPLRYRPEQGYGTLYTAMVLYSVGMLMLLAAWIGKRDRWLGLFIAWNGLLMIWSQTTDALHTVLYLALGGFGIVLARTFDERRRRIARLALIACGALQAAVALLQFAIQHGERAAFGLIAGSNFLGVYLAILAPLAPVWLLPLFLCGLVASQCLTGAVAMGVGLLVRFRAGTRIWAAAAAAAFAAIWLLKRDALSGWRARLDIWDFALKHQTWDAWLTGHGPGMWRPVMQLYQQTEGFLPNGLSPVAHNDWWQLVWETGLPGLALVLLWVWAHRDMFKGEYGGSCAAIAVGALGLFIFHEVALGLTCLLVLALATPNQEGDRA